MITSENNNLAIPLMRIMPVRLLNWAGASAASDDASTRLWKPIFRYSAKSTFSTFNAMSRLGAIESATKTVHVARQGVIEAGNDVSTKQWGWK